METTDREKLQLLREWVAALAAECDDEDLLDLVCKLLLQFSEG